MKIEYISHMGSDDMVCDSARVSFNKQASNYTKEQNVKLIAYLAKHKHISPFMHPQITLRETVPIFVARQRFKHVVGFVYNEVSRRYVDDAPDFFIPTEWRNRPEGCAKQGSSGVNQDQENTTIMYTMFLEKAKQLYSDMLKKGIAPEQARMVLPQSMYTSYYVTGSLSAFARLYNQRSDSHAQKEIQDVAHMIDDIISPLYPISWYALTKGIY